MTATGTPIPTGQAAMPPDFISAIHRQPTIRPAARPLTDREIEVLRLVAEGLSNPQIGRELYVTANTVKTNLGRACRKLGARDRAHAVALGFRSGVLQ